VTLAILIWALTATAVMAYYYMQNLTNYEQLQQRQKLMNELARNSEVSFSKWNQLVADYGALHGEYQWFQGENYASLMGKYERLIVNLKGNYTDLLDASSDLNETYNNLWQRYQTLAQQTIVEKTMFGELLSEFYKLFTTMAVKETGKFVGEATLIQVSLLINYTDSIEWHNVSIQLGASLFDLTRTVAKIEYSYWPTMEPGHILVTSINGSAEGYWLWYYWDEEKGDWVIGPVGCDAWMLVDGGVYKWHLSPF
jgi:hypothetical protein